MSFDFKEFLPAISSVFSALASGFTGWGLWFIRSIIKENKVLKKALEEVREQNLKGRMEEVRNEVTVVRGALETHIKEDNPELVAEKLAALTEAIRQSTSLQRHSELTISQLREDMATVKARLDTDIKAKDKWLDNLNSDFQTHANDRRLHNGN